MLSQKSLSSLGLQALGFVFKLALPQQQISLTWAHSAPDKKRTGIFLFRQTLSFHPTSQINTLTLMEANLRWIKPGQPVSYPG